MRFELRIRVPVFACHPRNGHGVSIYAIHGKPILPNLQFSSIGRKMRKKTLGCRIRVAGNKV
jgi:hypothetical protein